MTASRVLTALATVAILTLSVTAWAQEPPSTEPVRDQAYATGKGGVTGKISSAFSGMNLTTGAMFLGIIAGAAAGFLITNSVDREEPAPVITPTAPPSSPSSS